ncbi:MAG: hypothetical protein IPG50_19635 [Myxococcales bacterium]|nr:hypothetical protein [Myxococcales bacterium]
MNEKIKPNDTVQDEKSTEKQKKVEKKVPVIIELGESSLSDVDGGIVAYRCKEA